MNKYTNLQGISIGGSIYDHGEYNLTSLMFENLQHLKVLYLGYMNVYNIDESISKLQNLEIFRLAYSNTGLYVPFESIGNIKSLKAIHILNQNTMSNTFISENICQLTKIRYFLVTNGHHITNAPFDCIVENWLDLEYFELRVFTQLSYVPPQFWLMSNLKTVIFDWSSLNQSVFNFDSFKGYSNSLTTVSVHGNHKICQTHSKYTYIIDINGNDTSRSDVDSIAIDNISYAGFAYLYNNRSIITGFDDNDDNDYELGLLSFITEFDPCKQMCDVGSIGVCGRFEWRDGVCDDACNTATCGWDGGDCIQTCPAYAFSLDIDSISNLCHVDMLFNHECNKACNVTQCDYDLSQCAMFETNGTCNYNHNQVNNGAINNTSEYRYNYSNHDSGDNNYICYDEWIDDLWCDKNCNITQCSFDNYVCNDCATEEYECNNMYVIWTIISNIYPPNEVLTLPELCNNWNALGSFPDDILGSQTNCTLLFDASWVLGKQ